MSNHTAKLPVTGNAKASSAGPLVASLKQAHAALLKDFQKLEGWIGSPKNVDVAHLALHLENLRTHLLDHFRFEEKGGYMDAVRGRAPHLEREIARLEEEHVEMAGALGHLVDACRSCTRLADEQRQRIRDWIKQVYHHEAHENRLVEDAFNTDLGAKD